MPTQLLLLRRRISAGIHVHLSNILSTASPQARIIRLVSTALAFPATTMSNEFVEDSEPEREYIRMSQKARSKGRGNGNSSPDRGLGGDHSKQPRRDNRDVIDISSDISGVFPSPATPARKVIVTQERIIDISDSPDNSISSSGVHLAARAPISITQSPVFDISPIRPSRLGMYSHSGDVSNDDSGSFSRPELSRFALPPAQDTAGPSNTKKTNARFSPTTAATPEPVQEKAPVKRGRAPKSNLLGDIGESQLASLLKCVCCDIKWTTRKSSAQKATHISTCARKHNMASATVQSLIRKELENAPAPVTKPTATKEANVPPSQPTTHLEDVVNHAEPKKRGRRAVATATVQGPAIAQDGILDRARAVLHRENAPLMEQNTARRRPISTSGQVSPQAMPQATQPFRKSALAGQGRSLFFADREDPLQENPPATQAFGASKLGAMSRLQAPAPIASTSAISISSSSSDEPLPAFGDHSANVPSPQHPSTRTPPPLDVQPRSSSPIGSDRFEYGSDRFDYANDDFYNVQPGDDDWYDAPDLYDPEIRYSPPPLYLPRPLSPAPRERAEPGPSHLPVSPTDPDTPTDPPTAPTPVRKTAKKRAKKAPAAVVLDDEALEAEMKKLVLANEALYLRILRYEPIHFDVFYQLALSLNISDRGLRVRVRAVLDKQVISHYGAEPGGKRTRKQYHP
ncbi:hypothetical protein PENSPDRAFT_746952 [Peniophora sp. CONT]|nr:hypothetical protein PENSPDRAFT_746952 [Peniophora sp. CONT]